MKAEYFPPKEDVILQNEAPTDFYILVTGAVVIAELLCKFYYSILLLSLSLWSLIVHLKLKTGCSMPTTGVNSVYIDIFIIWNTVNNGIWYLNYFTGSIGSQKWSWSGKYYHTKHSGNLFINTRITYGLKGPFIHKEYNNCIMLNNCRLLARLKLVNFVERSGFFVIGRSFLQCGPNDWASYYGWTVQHSWILFRLMLVMGR